MATQSEIDEVTPARGGADGEDTTEPSKKTWNRLETWPSGGRWVP